MNIQHLLRNNIKYLKPYSSARDEYKGKDAMFLDANENPFNEPYNRYPDPLQRDLKEQIGKVKNISPALIFTGNGSDEPIDLLIRAFCNPGEDNVVVTDPTYGMYQVAADINQVEVRKVRLTASFKLDVMAMLNICDRQTKLIFICSPNNPTGNSLAQEDIEKIVAKSNALVVIDEAYIDFAQKTSWITALDKHENLVVLQTLSKAWGMAGIRLGMAFANIEIINVLNKIKYPYNVNVLTQKEAFKALQNTAQKDAWVKSLVELRAQLQHEISKLPLVKKVYESDANFFLAKVEDPINVYNYLVNKKIIVRDRSKITLCEGCLRITVGTKEQNEALVAALTDYIK
ncbi:MAG: histidinol-phosphate transaminase [Bacteroidales bacterium]|nr:histidinol-phosphate transaminase [Bacteroidales bacterium]